MPLGLCDVNNAYATFETIFRPSLRGRAVAIVGSNDGCVVSRSDEAKRLGVKMGAPLFKVRAELPHADITFISCNFELYGQISSRVMSIISGFGHRTEEASIDEAWSELSGIRGDLTARAHKIRERVDMWVGAQVSVGIAETKGLCKLAVHVAKQADRKPGSYPAELAKVCNLGDLSQAMRDQLMDATDLSEIWGVGPRLSEQLRAAGLRTALDVARMDPATARRRWSITMEKTVRELQGVSCIPLEEHPGPRREIAATRSFGRSVTHIAHLAEAITEFTARAAVKLRAQNHVACQILVFLRTSPFRKNDEQYSASIVVPLRRPTADTGHLVRAALSGMQAIYKDGINYAKAGITLLELQPAGLDQLEIQLDDDPSGRERLMLAMDTLNGRFGPGTVALASAGTAGEKRQWSVRQDMRSPCYTTRLSDILVFQA